MVLELSDRNNLVYLTLALLTLLLLTAVAEQTASAWGRDLMQVGFSGLWRTWASGSLTV